VVARMAKVATAMIAITRDACCDSIRFSNALPLASRAGNNMAASQNGQHDALVGCFETKTKAPGLGGHHALTPEDERADRSPIVGRSSS